MPSLSLHPLSADALPLDVDVVAGVDVGVADVVVEGVEDGSPGAFGGSPPPHATRTEANAISIMKLFSMRAG